jgi:predicted neutral ceramidase superfamily lipid hydrolase
MVETLVLIVASLFIFLALFQAALAFGAPWGAHAYGGRMAQDDGVLPRKWRAASAGASVVLVAFASVMLARAGVCCSSVNDTLVTVLSWMVVAYMAINAAMNFASKDPVERWLFGSVSALLVVLCAVIAASGPAGPTPVAAGVL